MRQLTLAEALTIAEAVRGIDAAVLPRVSRLERLDSALHAPQAGFGDQEFHPEFVDKAAVLTARIANNHSLPDGNKRLAWQGLTMLCVFNTYTLTARPADRSRRRRSSSGIARCVAASQNGTWYGSSSVKISSCALHPSSTGSGRQPR